MSKTIKDKARRTENKRFSDGGYKKIALTSEHLREKHLKNKFRSNNVKEFFEEY